MGAWHHECGLHIYISASPAEAAEQEEEQEEEEDEEDGSREECPEMSEDDLDVCSQPSTFTLPSDWEPVTG